MTNDVRETGPAHLMHRHQVLAQRAKDLKEALDGPHTIHQFDKWLGAENRADAVLDKLMVLAETNEDVLQYLNQFFGLDAEEEGEQA